MTISTSQMMPNEKLSFEYLP